MKTLRFLVTLYSCVALIHTPSLAQNGEKTRRSAPASSKSETVADRPTDQGQHAPTRGAEGRTDRQRAEDRPGRNHAATREKRPSDRKGQAGGKTERPLGARDHAAHARGETHQTSKKAPNAPQPAMKQSVNASRDAVPQNTVKRQTSPPAAPQSPGRMAGLAPGPIRNRGGTPAAIGGPAARAIRDTAAISGNAIRHKP